MKSSHFEQIFVMNLVLFRDYSILHEYKHPGYYSSLFTNCLFVCLPSTSLFLCFWTVCRCSIIPGGGEGRATARLTTAWAWQGGEARLRPAIVPVASCCRRVTDRRGCSHRRPPRRPPPRGRIRLPGAVIAEAPDTGEIYH